MKGLIFFSLAVLCLNLFSEASKASDFDITKWNVECAFVMPYVMEDGEPTTYESTLTAYQTKEDVIQSRTILARPDLEKKDVELTITAWSKELNIIRDEAGRPYISLTLYDKKQKVVSLYVPSNVNTFFTYKSGKDIYLIPKCQYVEAK